MGRYRRCDGLAMPPTFQASVQRAGIGRHGWSDQKPFTGPLTMTRLDMQHLLRADACGDKRRLSYHKRATEAEQALRCHTRGTHPQVRHDGPA